MHYPLGQRLRGLPGPVLLTGHTGFKGTWMSFLLEHLKIPVVGYSLPAEKDSLFDRAGRNGAIPERFADIRDYQILEEFMDRHKPSTIIHMAAQALVLKSYREPRGTFDVNVMGTANLLDIAFKKNFVKEIVVVTTDKVYRNKNSGRAYIESDPLEGKDPYSASKVGTEAVVAAWQQIAKISGGPKVVSVRAGNVIGGGDFAEDRLIPDLIRGLLSGKVVQIRNPESTRPWQHVLDPLIGYLRFVEQQSLMTKNAHLNFGPPVESITVKDATLILQRSLKPIGEIHIEYVQKHQKAMESKTLSLNSEQAKKILNWSPVIGSVEALEVTANWWINVLKNQLSTDQAILKDLRMYFERIYEK